MTLTLHSDYCKFLEMPVYDLIKTVETAVKAANAIASQGIDYFRESLDALNNCTDLTKNAYETIANTFQHQSQLIKTNWDNLGISVFDSLSGPLAHVLKLVNEAMPAIQTAISGAAENIGNLLASGLDYAIPQIAAFKDKAVQIFNELSPAFEGAGTAAQEAFTFLASTALPQIATAVLTVIDKLADLGIFLAEHKSLVTAAIAAYAGFKKITALSALGGKIAAANKALETIQTVTKGTSLAVSAANGRLSAMGAAFGVLSGKIKLSELAAETMKNKISGLTGNLKSLGSFTMRPFVQWFQNAQMQLKLFTMSTENANIAQTSMNGTLKFSETVVALLTRQVTVSELAHAAWAKVTTAVSAAQKGLLAVLKAHPAIAVVAAIAAVIAIVIVLYNKCEWFRQKVDTVIEAVKGCLTAFGNEAKEVFQNIQAVVQNVWTQIQPYLTAAWQNIITAVSAVVSFFKLRYYRASKRYGLPSAAYLPPHGRQSSRYSPR